MFILKHFYHKDRKREFKTKKTLRQFLRRNKWCKDSIDYLVKHKSIFGWKIKEVTK